MGFQVSDVEKNGQGEVSELCFLHQESIMMYINVSGTSLDVDTARQKRTLFKLSMRTSMFNLLKLTQKLTRITSTAIGASHDNAEKTQTGLIESAEP